MSHRLLFIYVQQGLEPHIIRNWDYVDKSPGLLIEPGAVAILARGHPDMDLIFVADPMNHRIQSVRSDATIVARWGSLGSADGEFNNPRGVAVLARSQDRILVQSQDPTRNCVFVSDCDNHRIQVFGIDGSFVRKWGSQGNGDGQFYYPCGVAVLARSQDRILQKHPTQDLVFVADSGNQRVQVFNPNGSFVMKWGTRGFNNGQFFNPWGVAVHPSRDLVFISDFQGNHIQAFRSDGTFLFQWGSHGSADGQFSLPKHLTLHPTRDLLFVTDSANHRVQIFDLDGSFVCKWGSEGQADGEFYFPSGIAVHPTDDEVYVSDEHQVQVFSMFRNGRKCKRV